MLRPDLLVEPDDNLDGSSLAVDAHDLAIAESLAEDGVSRLQGVELLLSDGRGLGPLGNCHLGEAPKPPSGATTARLAATQAELETGALVGKLIHLGIKLAADDDPEAAVLPARVESVAHPRTASLGRRCRIRTTPPVLRPARLSRGGRRWTVGAMAMRGGLLPGPRAIPQPPCGGSLRVAVASNRPGTWQREPYSLSSPSSPSQSTKAAMIRSVRPSMSASVKSPWRAISTSSRTAVPGTSVPLSFV